MIWWWLACDQYQISPAASPEIWHHTVWRTWLSTAYSDERWLYYQFSLPSVIQFSLQGWESVLFELGTERVNLSGSQKLKTQDITFARSKTLDFGSARFSNAQAKRSSQLKPTRAKFTTSMELGIVWPPTCLELARVRIELKFWPNSSQVFHRLATSANSSQLSPSCFVIVMYYVVVFRQFEWFLASWLDLAVWFGHRADASFDFVTWFELARVGNPVWPGLSARRFPMHCAATWSAI